MEYKKLQLTVYGVRIRLTLEISVWINNCTIFWASVRENRLASNSSKSCCGRLEASMRTELFMPSAMGTRQLLETHET